MRRVLSFFSGTLMGALVGSTLALLLAPASGEDLRAKFKQQAENIETEVKQAATSRRAELEAQLATLREPRKPGETQQN